MVCPTKFSKGFSLVEVIVVVAVLGLLASIIGPVYRAVQTKNNLDITVASIVQATRRAQSLSTQVADDAAWGVYIENTRVTVFQGATYASRSQSYDEVQNLPGGVTVSGLLEVGFSKFIGLPSQTGTIAVTSGFGTKNISINAKGTLTY